MLIIYYVPVQNKIKNTLFKRRTLFNLNPHCVIHIRPTNKTYRHGASKMFCETKLCIINYNESSQIVLIFFAEVRCTSMRNAKAVLNCAPFFFLDPRKKPIFYGAKT